MLKNCLRSFLDSGSNSFVSVVFLVAPVCSDYRLAGGGGVSLAIYLSAVIDNCFLYTGNVCLGDLSMTG